ncbi:hypothetical protein N1F73_03570, partial [Mycoplasma sp. HS2188]|nr:hypothetical protein [Mycoplasma sp. HS2188]
MILVENKIKSLLPSDIKTALTQKINQIKTDKTKQNYNELAALYKQALDRAQVDAKLSQLREKINKVKDLLPSNDDKKAHLETLFNNNSSMSTLDNVMNKVDSILEREHTIAVNRAKEAIEKLPALVQSYNRQSKLREVESESITTTQALELEKEAKATNQSILTQLQDEIAKMPANARTYLNNEKSLAEQNYNGKPNATDGKTIGDKLLELQTLAANTVKKSNEFNTKINEAFADKNGNTINVSKYRDVLQKSFRNSSKADTISEIQGLIDGLPTLKRNFETVRDYFLNDFNNDKDIPQNVKNIYKNAIQNITKSTNNPAANSYSTFDVINGSLVGDADSLLNQMKFNKTKVEAQRNINSLSNNGQKTYLQPQLDGVHGTTPENIKQLEDIRDEASGLKTKLESVKTKIDILDSRATGIKTGLTNQWNSTNRLGNDTNEDTAATAYGLDKKVDAIKTELDLTTAEIEKINDVGYKATLGTELGEVGSTLANTDKTITDLQAIKTKAENWEIAYSSATAAVNELKDDSPQKNDLKQRLNNNGKTINDLKRILKDAKIDKVLESTAEITNFNPKRRELENQLNALKADPDLDNYKDDLRRIQETVDSIYDVTYFIPTTHTPFSESVIRIFNWKKRDVIGYLTIDKLEGDYSKNKWLYIVAKNEHNVRVISEPIPFNTKELNFTFLRKNLLKDGTYSLEKVVVANSNRESAQSILSSNELINTKYANQSNFRVQNNGDIKAENVTLLFRNIPGKRSGDHPNPIELIEAASNNEFILSGFKTEGVTIKDGSVSIRLKGLAQIDKNWSYVRTKQAIKEE